MSEANSASFLTSHRYADVPTGNGPIMAFDRRHILAQWGGTLPGGEIWSNSLRLCGDETGPTANVPTHSEMVAWCTGPAKTAVSAYHSASGTYISSPAMLTFLKMNVVDMDGHYTDQNTIEYIYPSPVGGGGANQAPPNQITLAVSLTTGLNRGLAHRGRFYLPGPGHQVLNSDGRISASSAMATATTTAAFLLALADEPGIDTEGGMRVCVMSKVGAGATHVVNGVAVGRVLDTQRRRRTELPEDYQQVSFDPTGG